MISIPSLIKVARIKKLYDEPDQRKNHSCVIPTLGGVAIFAGFITALCFFTWPADFFQMKFIISAVLIMSFIGIKDDIVSIPVNKKLISQFVVAFILVYWGNIRLTSFYGMFGIYQVPFIASFLLSIFAILFITNSFNFIDGIDGLAASIGIVVSTAYGVWFYFIRDNAMSVLAFSLVGPLIGFLRYNKHPSRMFMGDTGSLLLGIVISILTIKFIEINRVNWRSPQYVIASPAVALGILLIPTFDTIRVVFIRILNKKSPFTADRNHIHHLLRDIGLSDNYIVVILSTFNILFIAAAFSLQTMGSEYLSLLLLGTALILVAIIEILKHNRNRCSTLLKVRDKA